MRHSLNEVEVTLRKAAVGAGLPIGLAEDISRAAAWLVAGGLDGAGAGLTAVEAGKTISSGVVMDDGTVRFDTSRIACDGPSAIDFLIAGQGRVMAQMTKPDSILLMAGLAGAAAAVYGGAFRFEFDDGSAATVVSAHGLDPAELPEAPVSVQISWQPEAGTALSTINTSGIEVEDGVWNRIVALAAKTYVPESEESRLQGAGAGLLDND